MQLTPVTKAALVLGLLSAVGPFAIDMFLSALPAIASDLNASVTATQGTITFYFLAFGLAQMIYGPWSDQVGRKIPVFAGLGIFGLGSVAATLAPSIEWLILARVAQGLGGAALMVITRAIIRDQFTGYDATRLMSLVILVFSVSPLFAPIAGAALTATIGWRAIFASMAIAAVLSGLLTAFYQPETLAKADRVRVNLRTMGQGVAILLRDPVFLGLTLIGGLGLAAFFVFVASGAFVYEATFGLTPTQFSLAFSINAMGFIGASQASAPLMKRFGMLRLITFGTFGGAITLIGLYVVLSTGGTALPVLVGGLIVSFAFMGLVIPTAMVAALDPHGDIAGLASSLGGTLQMLVGGVMVAAAGPFFDGSPAPMIATMAVCVCCAAGLSLAIRRPVKQTLSFRS